MSDLATLRLTWEPRMLSILRMMVGLLYMEHGLAKVLGFPPQPNHAPYALFNLNPGLQGLLELVGGIAARAWFVHPHGPLCPRGQHGSRLLHGPRAERFLPAAQRRRVGNRLLLRLPLSLGRRGRRMEPRSNTRACIRLIAEPGLSAEARRLGPPSTCRRGWAAFRGQLVARERLRIREPQRGWIGSRIRGSLFYDCFEFIRDCNDP